MHSNSHNYTVQLVMPLQFVACCFSVHSPQPACLFADNIAGALLSCSVRALHALQAILQVSAHHPDTSFTRMITVFSPINGTAVQASVLLLEASTNQDTQCQVMTGMLLLQTSKVCRSMQATYELAFERIWVRSKIVATYLRVSPANCVQSKSLKWLLASIQL